MLAVERRARIVERVRGAWTISTEALAQQLGVSIETIRRDLVALEDRGLLARVHGGAAVVTERGLGDEPSFEKRTRTNEDVKQRIGALAASMLVDGQTVMIDVGTTALAVARAIPDRWRGSVVTCSLLAAVELGDRPGIDVLVCGGRVRSGDLTLSNHLAERFFAEVHPDIAFLGSGGVDATAGLTDYHFDEIVTRRIVLRNAAQSWVLADSSKLGRVAQHAVAPLGDLSGIITDRAPDERLSLAMSEHGGDILVA